MQRRFKAAALIVVLAAFSSTLVGCSQLGVLKARKAFKEANTLYPQQEYKRAADKYEEVVANDPTLTAAYFYLANSYDNLYKPSRKGEAANDEFLKKAIENYRKCADKEKDPLLRKRSLEYLVNAYGPDKMADPGQAVPIIEEMIKLEPTEPSNYFVLSKMYEDAGTTRWPSSSCSRPRRCGRTPRTPTCSWPASTTARASSRRRCRRSTSARRRNRTTPRRSTRSPPTTGRRPTETSG